MLLSSLFPATANAQDVTSNLISNWKLDETSGTTISDTTGNNPGTFTGATNVTGYPGKVASGIKFDGTDDYVTAADSATLDISSSFTMAAWANFRSPGVPAQYLMEKAVSGDGANYYMYYENGEILCGFFYNSTTEFEISYTYTPATNTWNHYACVFNDSLNALMLYINGAEVKRGITTQSPYADNGSFNIGRSPYWSTNFLNGYIDDVRLYSRALSAADITSLVQNTEGKIRFNTDNRTPEYFNGSTWIAMGQGMYIPNAVGFDGSPYLSTNAAITGIADGTQVTGSFWFKRDGDFTTRQMIWASQTTGTVSDNNGRFRIEFATDNRIEFIGQNTTPGILLDAKTSTQFTDTAWHHIMFSFDITSGTARYIYVDGAADLNGTPTTHTNGTIDFAVATPRYTVGGRSNGTLPLNGWLSEFWLDFGNYVDISAAENRAKFRDARGSPVYLGADGSLPFGVKPEVFLSGVSDSWQTNDTANGGFTENNTLIEPAIDKPGGLKMLSQRGVVTHANLNVGEEVQVQGNYAFITLAGSDRLTAVNISDPDNPTYVSSLQDGTYLDSAMGLVVDGNYAYVASAFYGIAVVDISNPASMSVVGHVANATTLPGPLALAKQGNYLYVSAGGTRFTIVDVSNPASPTVAGSVSNSTTMNAPWGVAVSGNYAYVAITGSNRVTVVNVSNPASPSISGNVTNANLASTYPRVALRGNYFYVTADDADALTILDISNPAAPAVVGSVISSALDLCDGITLVGNYAYLACYNNNSVTAVDITSPYSPFVASVLRSDTNIATPNFITSSGNNLYLSSETGSSLSIVSIDGSYCSSPKRKQGTILYNDTQNVLQYCDGVNWRQIGKPGAGGAGCSSPSRGEGKMIYNSTEKVMQYCDGANWQMIGKQWLEPTSGLVGYWPMENGSGTTATDAAGGNNNGTLSNGPAWSPGKVGNYSLFFDDVNDTITTANESTFDFNRNNSFTISAWAFRMGTTTGEDDIVEKYVSGPLGYWLFFAGASTTLVFGMENGAGGRIEVTTPVTNNEWHLITATYDGSSTAAGTKIYVDGVQRSVIVNYDTLSSGSLLHNGPLTIGDDGSGTPNNAQFNGYLDDVRVYNRALSDSEVKALYYTTGGQ